MTAIPRETPSITPLLVRGLSEPRKAIDVALALLRGRLVVLWCRMRGIRLRVGRNFRVFGTLHVSGPGEVIFGNDVVILQTVTPWTYSHDARIVVGDNVMLGGTQFGCQREITIGRDSIIAKASITDTDFHSTRADRRSNVDAPVRVAPVHIGENVWIGQFAGLLPGTRIGRNSVVSFGAICFKEYPENAIIMGNPARVAAPIPSMPGATTAQDAASAPAASDASMPARIEA